MFGIGANKTGSTSLSQVFDDVGLVLAPQAEGELTAAPLSRGNFRPLVDYVAKYDAFQDVPFATKATYAQVDALFPGSKFVLTVRDPDAWFESFLNHHRRNLAVSPPRLPVEADFRGPHQHLYDGFRTFKFESDWLLTVDEGSLHCSRDWRLLFDRETFIRAYVRRNTEVVRYFSERPADLLVIDVSRETSTEKIVRFLGLPGSLVGDMPHLNKASVGA